MRPRCRAGSPRLLADTASGKERLARGCSAALRPRHPSTEARACAQIKTLRQDLQQAFSRSQADLFKGAPDDVPHSERSLRG